MSKTNWMVALFTGLILVPASIGHAGSRELYILFVNMTPDALSDDASEQCIKQIRRSIRMDTKIKTMGETRLRKTAGFPDKSDSFLEWPASAFIKPKENSRSYYHDTVVLVDCRPSENSVSVSVSPPAGGVSHSKIRHLKVTKKLTKWIGAMILQRGWEGFSP